MTALELMTTKMNSKYHRKARGFTKAKPAMGPGPGSLLQQSQRLARPVC